MFSISTRNGHRRQGWKIASKKLIFVISIYKLTPTANVFALQ